MADFSWFFQSHRSSGMKQKAATNSFPHIISFCNTPLSKLKNVASIYLLPPLVSHVVVGDRVVRWKQGCFFLTDLACGHDSAVCLRVGNFPVTVRIFSGPYVFFLYVVSGLFYLPIKILLWGANLSISGLFSVFFLSHSSHCYVKLCE